MDFWNSEKFMNLVIFADYPLAFLHTIFADHQDLQKGKGD